MLRLLLYLLLLALSLITLYAGVLAVNLTARMAGGQFQLVHLIAHGLKLLLQSSRDVFVICRCCVVGFLCRQ